ncbi:MAG: sigma-54 interaction domain-containing protein [Prolixibacteraceae bacterium]|jgi:Nif-specific regulatory protein|nr:sigma 54-interacting transcriptional regulator [Prolixibacteraceae bacterium]
MDRDNTICNYTGKPCNINDEMNLLFKISKTLIRNQDVSTTLTPILKMVCEHLKSDSSFLAILNRQRSQIVVGESYGLSPAQESKGKFKVGEGIIGRVVELARPVVIENLGQSKFFSNKMNQLTNHGDNYTFICVPIFQDDQVVGTLSTTIQYGHQDSYEGEKRLLAIIGTMLVQAVKTKQHQMEEIEKLRAENIGLKQTSSKAKNFSSIVGNSSKMKDVFNQVSLVAKTQSTVLIRGESGIGKEMIADAIHFSSDRADKPFIKVNCSAIPEALIESELFGHERGAFTGADSRRKGRFELADGGTIFLDEIGDLPMPTQVKLLRALQERTFERLGGTETLKTDVRFVCATNRNLEEMMTSGEFREDLFYRINVFPLFVPALRERKNDIPLLVDHFIQKYNKQNNASIHRITQRAMDRLMMYSWPGNVRELENTIERACIMAHDNVIHSYSLPTTLQIEENIGEHKKDGLEETICSIEKQVIQKALSENKGSIKRTSEQLKISERKLGLRLTKYKIKAAEYKNKKN